MHLFLFNQQNAEQKEAFDDYMNMRREVAQAQWFETYPAETELAPENLRKSENEVLVVDVGGGRGHEIGKFRERFPGFQGMLVLQDLPETIRGIEKVPNGIEAMQHNFFDPQSVRGAKIYYFRAVLHDWPDADCKRILRRTIDSMDPAYSRILIDDFVMADVRVDQRPASIGALIMLLVSVIERDMSHWKELIGSVGLKIVKIWQPKVRRESVIECKIKQV